MYVPGGIVIGAEAEVYAFNGKFETSVLEFNLTELQTGGVPLTFYDEGVIFVQREIALNIEMDLSALTDQQTITFNLVDFSSGIAPDWTEDMFVITGAQSAHFSNGSYNASNGTYTVTYTANPVPEPTASILALLGLGAVLLRRRR